MAVFEASSPAQIYDDNLLENLRENLPVLTNPQASVLRTRGLHRRLLKVEILQVELAPHQRFQHCVLDCLLVPGRDGVKHLYDSNELPQSTAQRVSPLPLVARRVVVEAPLRYFGSEAAEARDTLVDAIRPVEELFELLRKLRRPFAPQLGLGLHQLVHFHRDGVKPLFHLRPQLREKTPDFMARPTSSSSFASSTTTITRHTGEIIS